MTLPAPYADLEAFMAWAQPTFDARTAWCNSVPMEDAQAFYAAMFPRLEEIVGYLNAFPARDMPAAEQNLARLVFSLVHISLAVEIYRQIEMPNCPRGRLPMWPAVSAANW